METERVLMIAGTDCPPEVEGEFDKWYSEKHTPDACKFKGIRQAIRFKLVDSAALDIAPTIIDEGARYPKFLAVYEFENREALKEWDTSPERKAALDDFASWVSKGVVLRCRAYYEPIMTLKK